MNQGGTPRSSTEAVTSTGAPMGRLVISPVFAVFTWMRRCVPVTTLWITCGAYSVATDATEYAPQVIHSVVTGTQRRIQVNTANTGLITNLPIGAPVEVTASVDERGVPPWFMGALVDGGSDLDGRAYGQVGDQA